MTNQLSKDKIVGLEKVLCYEFKDLNLLKTALTHRSARRSNSDQDYERLEFVGDAVLDLAIAHILYNQYTNKKEGELSKMRAALVNTESLASIARELELGSLIDLSPGERTSGGAEKNSILADIVEAIFGAIYLEAGFTSAFGAAIKVFGELTTTVKPKDPKTELQEFLHTIDLPAPKYKLVESDGPDHAPIFYTIVVIKNKEYGHGTGTSKKVSQQAAAAATLTILKTKKKTK